MVESIIESEPVVGPRTAAVLGKPCKAMDYSHAFADEDEDQAPFQLADNIELEASNFDFPRESVHDLDSPSMQFIERRQSDRLEKAQDELKVDIGRSGIQLSDTDLFRSSAAGSSSLSLKSPLLLDPKGGGKQALDIGHLGAKPQTGPTLAEHQDQGSNQVDSKEPGQITILYQETPCNIQ